MWDGYEQTMSNNFTTNDNMNYVNQTIEDNVVKAKEVFQDSITTVTNVITKNGYKNILMAILSLFLAAYVNHAQPKLPKYVIDIIQSPFSRLVLITYILYSANDNPELSLMIAFVFLVLMHIINRYNIVSTINTAKNKVIPITNYVSSEIKPLTNTIKSSVNSNAKNINPMLNRVKSTIFGQVQKLIDKFTL
jgi:predicted PurR-regulated permease PerM